MNQQILQYLSKYKDNYSYDALKGQLINSGFSSEEIDEAYEKLKNSPDDNSPPTVVPSHSSEKNQKSKLSLTETMKNLFSTFAFDEEAVLNLSHNKNGIWHGLLAIYILFIIIGVFTARDSVAVGMMGNSGLAYLIMVILGFIISPLILLGIVIVNSIYHFVAKFLLGGDARGVELLRVLIMVAVSLSIVGTLFQMIHSVLGYIVNIFNLVLMIFVIKNVYKFSYGKAILTIVIPAVIFVTLAILILGGAIFSNLV